MATINPSSATTTPTSMPSANLSLTDPHTVAAILTSVAAIVSVLFHRDYSAYIPAASIIVAGAVLVALLISKHLYAKALMTVASSTSAAAAVAPATVSADLTKAAQVATDVAAVQADVSAATKTA